MYPFCYQCAQNYQSRWKFDKVMAKTILHSFFVTQCICGETVFTFHYAVVHGHNTPPAYSKRQLTRLIYSIIIIAKHIEA